MCSVILRALICWPRRRVPDALAPPLSCTSIPRTPSQLKDKLTQRDQDLLERVSVVAADITADQVSALRSEIPAAVLKSLQGDMKVVEEQMRVSLTKNVKEVVVVDLEKKMHAALDDALNTIRNEVRA